MSESLDRDIAAKFEGKPDSYLVRRMERAADFAYDDESYELDRRLKLTGLAWRWAQRNGRDVVMIYEPQPTDEELIYQELARAAEAGDGISDAGARVIASQFHDGQTSALYSLASTGALDRDELERELATNRREYHDNPRVLAWLDALDAYVTHRDESETVAGWSDLWLRKPHASD